MEAFKMTCYLFKHTNDKASLTLIRYLNCVEISSECSIILMFTLWDDLSIASTDQLLGVKRGVSEAPHSSTDHNSAIRDLM